MPPNDNRPTDDDLIQQWGAQADIDAYVAGGEEEPKARARVVGALRKAWENAQKQQTPQVSVRGTPQAVRSYGAQQGQRTTADRIAGKPAAGVGAAAPEQDQIEFMKRAGEVSLTQAAKAAELQRKNTFVVAKSMDYAQFHSLISQGVDPNLAAQMSQKTIQVPQRLQQLQATHGEVAGRNIFAQEQDDEQLRAKLGPEGYLQHRKQQLEQSKANMRAAMFSKTQPGPAAEEIIGTPRLRAPSQFPGTAAETLGEPGGLPPGMTRYGPTSIESTPSRGYSEGPVGLPINRPTITTSPDEAFINKTYAAEEQEIMGLERELASLRGTQGKATGYGTAEQWQAGMAGKALPPTPGAAPAAPAGDTSNETAYEAAIKNLNLAGKIDTPRPDGSYPTADEVIREEVTNRIVQSPSLTNNKFAFEQLFSTNPSVRSYEFIKNFQTPDMEEVGGKPGQAVSRVLYSPEFAKIKEAANIVELGALSQWLGGRSSYEMSGQQRGVLDAITKLVQNTMKQGALPAAIIEAYESDGNLQQALADDWSEQERNEFRQHLEDVMREEYEKAYILGSYKEKPEKKKSPLDQFKNKGK